MATMPDLNLNEVGVMAFWNIEDEGYDPDEVNWDELTTAFDEYTVYDNGYIGTVENVGPSGKESRDYTVRVKSDGWFVIYLDDTLSTEAEDGPWDMLSWSVNSPYVPKLDDEDGNIMLKTLRDVAGELSENPAVLTENTHYYSPLHPDAGVLSVLSCGQSAGSSSIEYTITEEVVIEGVYVASETEGTHSPSAESRVQNLDTDEFLFSHGSGSKTGILTDDLETDVPYSNNATGYSSGGDGAVMVMQVWWW